MKNSRWKIIACSVPGTSHIAAGIPCQDACEYRALDDGIVIGALADGAGSARYARQGSSIAVRAAVEYLAGRLSCDKPQEAESCRAILHDCIFHVRKILEKEAQAINPDEGSVNHVNDLATTLIAFCLVEPFFAAVQIGDGAIVCRKNSDALLVICAPERCEYLNETSFMTSDDFDQHCHFAIESSSDLNALSLFSDGLQMLALVYRDNSPHGPFFNPLFDFFLQEGAGTEDLRQFLSSDRVWERSDDDKTMMVAVRVPANDRC